MSLPRALRAGVLMCVSLAAAAPALALPTMIRLGYPTCASCHISPQGGGLLNEYGRGVDEAQSLRGGEYAPDSPGTWNLGGRVTQDLRTVIQYQESWTGNTRDDKVFHPRLMYRNATELGAGFRVSAVVTAETDHAPRPPVPYDPPATAATLFVNTAMLHYRFGESAEVAVGRDQLPSGINVPDMGIAIKARERMGYYDAPTQAKLFIGGKRFQVVPFIFAPGGNDPMGEAEKGLGSLAEFDLAGHGRTVVGMSVARGVSSTGERLTTGGYARLGFGSWGILAEHDVTDRSRPALAPSPFQQQASYAQLFWAMREWLVASAIGERLTVQSPFEERYASGKLELNARLTSQATIGVSGRLQRNLLTNELANSIMVQAAFKTVR